MKIQIIWADPRETRFKSGDILGDAEIAEFGLDVPNMVAVNEVQILEAHAPARTRKTK